MGILLIFMTKLLFSLEHSGIWVAGVLLHVIYFNIFLACEPPFVWRNDSLCHSQTCDRRVTNDDCADKLLPACVCPENMYLKDGKCVNIVDCFKCEVNGVVYRVRRFLIINEILVCFCRKTYVHMYHALEIKFLEFSFYL